MSEEFNQRSARAGDRNTMRCLVTPRSHYGRARSTNRTGRHSPDSAAPSYHIAFRPTLIGGSPWVLQGCNLHFVGRSLMEAVAGRNDAIR